MTGCPRHLVPSDRGGHPETEIALKKSHPVTLVVQQAPPGLGLNFSIEKRAKRPSRKKSLATSVEQWPTATHRSLPEFASR